MKNNVLLSGASALALLLAASVAQAQGTLIGTEALNDRIDDIEENVQDDFDESNDEARFANPSFRPGLSGSASLSYSGKTGENDSQDLELGARLRYASGQLVQNIGLAIEFSDFEGSTTQEDVFGVYEANYYFTDQFYAFALGRVVTDGLADEADEYQTDAFIGVGPGYRVVNTPDMTWRVQAGVGFSYLEDGLGDTVDEVGYLASSRFYYRFNENMFATNDTDILSSDEALRINNDLGFNFKMTDAFATRISYLTDYNDSRATRTENKLGLSLVYGF